MVVAGIDSDPVEPGGERGPRPESPDGKIGFEKDFLNQILYVLPAPQKTACKGKDTPLMQLEQGLEGFMVPPLRLLDQEGFSLWILPACLRRLLVFLPVTHTSGEAVR